MILPKFPIAFLGAFKVSIKLMLIIIIIITIIILGKTTH